MFDKIKVLQKNNNNLLIKISMMIEKIKNKYDKNNIT